MTKRYGGPTPADYLAEMLQRRGMVVDMQRLEDRVLAVRERRRAKNAESIDRVRQLGCQVWKARAASGAAQRYRRLEPTESTLGRRWRLRGSGARPSGYSWTSASVTATCTRPSSTDRP